MKKSMKNKTNTHFLGTKGAPITLLEYGDYECPRSAKAYEWVQQLIHEFPHDVYFIYKHFPLIDIHPHSALAAMAAEAATRKNLFWEMHRLLIKNYQALSGEKVISLAQEIGLDIETFLHDLDSKELMDFVCLDIISAEESGIRDTPSFLVNNQILKGPINYVRLREEIMHNLGSFHLR